MEIDLHVDGCTRYSSSGKNSIQASQIYQGGQYPAMGRRKQRVRYYFVAPRHFQRQLMRVSGGDPQS